MFHSLHFTYYIIMKIIPFEDWVYEGHYECALWALWWTVDGFEIVTISQITLTGWINYAKH